MTPKNSEVDRPDNVTIVWSKDTTRRPAPAREAIMLGEPLRSEYQRLLEPNDSDNIGG
jgi:hypothetical protein